MTIKVIPPIRVLRFDEIDSTNAEAQRLALDGERGPLWIVAKRQVQGRGRQGRYWVSEPGNLFATCLMTLAIAPATAIQLSFVAALAVLETVQAALAAAAPKAALKWPNDVLIGWRKCAGILAETIAVPDASGLSAAIGCGMNVAHAPMDTPYPVTCLKDHGFTGDAETIFERLASNFARQCAAWDEGRGFEVIRQCWLAQALGLGGAVVVETGQSRIEGTFVNLAPDGALIIRLASGEQRPIHGGEIRFAEIEKRRNGQ